MMKYYSVLACTFLSFVVVAVNGSNEPTSRELLKKLCDRKIGGLFKKCNDEAPTPAPKKGKMGMEDKGKGKRYRRTTIEEFMDEELLMVIDSLSPDDKKRVLIAVEEEDEETVDVIFNQNRQVNDLNGRSLLKKLCDRKIGGLFKKCDDEAPTPAPKKGKMGKDDKDKGKGKRRTLTGKKVDDLLALILSLSSEDKNRVLIATEEGDDEAINLIFDQNIQENNTSGRNLLKKLCDRKIGGLFKKCDDEAPTPAPKKGKMGKEDKGKGKRRRIWEGSAKDDLVMFIGKLSPDNKIRLLHAIDSNDDATVDAIFDRFI